MGMLLLQKQDVAFFFSTVSASELDLCLLNSWWRNSALYCSTAVIHATSIPQSLGARFMLFLQNGTWFVLFLQNTFILLKGG